MKRSDFFTMLYQFFGAGIIFFFIVIEDFSNPLNGKMVLIKDTIYPLEFLGIYVGLDQSGFIFYFILIPLIFISLGMQRKIYVNQEIKKAAKLYKK